MKGSTSKLVKYSMKVLKPPVQSTPEMFQSIREKMIRRFADFIIEVVTIRVVTHVSDGLY